MEEERERASKKLDSGISVKFLDTVVFAFKMLDTATWQTARIPLPRVSKSSAGRRDRCSRVWLRRRTTTAGPSGTGWYTPERRLGTGLRAHPFGSRMRVSRIIGLAVVVGAAILARAAVTRHSVIAEFNGESARSLSARDQAAVAEVQDPVYKTRKRYGGIWLKDIIAGARLQSPGDSYLLFRSRDGYWPMMPVSKALEGKGLIALQGADAPRSRKWLPFQTDTGLSEPAPACLVWADQPTYSKSFPGHTGSWTSRSFEAPT